MGGYKTGDKIRWEGVKWINLAQDYGQVAGS